MSKAKNIKVMQSDCIKAVLQHFDISLEKLKFRSRTRGSSAARFIAAAILRKYTKASYNRIAQLIGYDNHTSVIYAIKRANIYERLSCDLNAVSRLVESNAAVLK